MSRSSAPLGLSALLLAGIGMLACGTTQRQMTSMVISPANADAQNFPNGQVQFSATGHYSKAPTTAPLQPALWGIFPSSGGKGGPTIDSTGIAQCGTGVAGNYMVLAYALADPSIPNTNANLIKAKKAVLGTAQLVCP